MLTEGIFDCKVLSATAGTTDDGTPNVQIVVEITSGPDAGRRVIYDDAINAHSAQYVARSMRAVGWTGPHASAIKVQCDEWIKKTGGKSTVEIKHLEIRKGRRAGEIWDKVNSIGRGAAKALTPLTKSADAETGNLLARALEGSGDSGNNDMPF